MRLIYTFIVVLLTPLLTLWMGYKMLRQKQFTKLKARFGFIATLPSDFWIHAASVGEVNACVPFIKQLQSQHPAIRITISTVTCTGYFEVKRQLGNDFPHFFFGFDLPWIWRRVLSRLQPKKLILVERELWPNLLYQCQKQAIPVDIINAKFSAKTQKKVRQLAALFLPALQSLHHVYAQSAEDCQALQSNGVAHCSVTGNIKFDIEIQPSILQTAKQHRQLIGERPLWVAGSTHPDEETFLLQLHHILLNSILEHVRLMMN